MITGAGKLFIQESAQVFWLPRFDLDLGIALISWRDDVLCSPVSVHEFDAVWAHRVMGREDGSWVAGSRAGCTQSIQAW